MPRPLRGTMPTRAEAPATVPSTWLDAETVRIWVKRFKIGAHVVQSARRIVRLLAGA
ncbi:MAG: hypothetical protein ACOYN0_08190 [Phycisphaerales bacterium]